MAFKKRYAKKSYGKKKYGRRKKGYNSQSTYNRLMKAGRRR